MHAALKKGSAVIRDWLFAPCNFFGFELDVHRAPVMKYGNDTEIISDIMTPI